MAKRKSDIQELSEFIRDHMATKEDVHELKGDIARVSEQVASIETQLRDMKYDHIEARVTDLEEKVFGTTRA